MTKPAASAQYEDVSESDRPAGIRLETIDAVYEREYAYVYRTLGRLGVPPADVPDLLHDVFVVLFRRWDELDHARSLRPWLFGVARKLAAARRRRDPDGVAAPDPAVAASDDALAARDLLWKALALLAEERRAVLVLHDLEGRTGADIASALGIPVNTVHSRLRLAREDLLAALERLGAPR